MATVSNDNLLELYLNPTYLFPMVGALLGGLTVYLLGFNKTSSTPPTIQLFTHVKEKEKKPIVVGKKEKKRDNVNSTSNAVTNSPAKSSSKIQSNGKLSNSVKGTPVATKKVKNAKNAKASPKEITKANVTKKSKKTQAKNQTNEVPEEIDQMLNDTSDGEWQVVKRGVRSRAPNQ